MGTRPGSTLMGLILPGLIRNRVEYGFKKKKKNPNRIRGLSKKSETRPETQPGYNSVFLKLPKNPPIYIAITNPKIPHFFSTQQQLAAHASLTQKHTHSHAHASPLSCLLSLFLKIFATLSLSLYLKLSPPTTLSAVDDFD